MKFIGLTHGEITEALMSQAIHFELAGPYRDYIYALALTEHFGHLLSTHCLTEVGDFVDAKDPASFRALGLLQMHPPFIQQYYGRGSFPADVNDSQTDMQIKAAASYFEKWLDVLTLDGTVQAFNKGVAAYERGERNPVYLQRFSDALNRIHDSQPALKL